MAGGGWKPRALKSRRRPNLETSQCFGQMARTSVLVKNRAEECVCVNACAQALECKWKRAHACLAAHECASASRRTA
eukprot:7922023-Alexandrium_andersonii.AAC.1